MRKEGDGMKGFFLPWNEREKQVKWGEKKLYLPKETLSLTDAAFDTHKPAYVSLPNPRGTLRSFLQAVESGKKDEAMGYFSERVAEVVDYEEVAGFLKDLKEYQKMFCSIRPEIGILLHGKYVKMNCPKLSKIRLIINIENIVLTKRNVLKKQMAPSIIGLNWKK
jgi:hypothetical protein